LLDQTCPKCGHSTLLCRPSLLALVYARANHTCAHSSLLCRPSPRHKRFFTSYCTRQHDANTRVNNDRGSFVARSHPRRLPTWRPLCSSSRTRFARRFAGLSSLGTRWARLLRRARRARQPLFSTRGPRRACSTSCPRYELVQPRAHTPPPPTIILDHPPLATTQPRSPPPSCGYPPPGGHHSRTHPLPPQRHTSTPTHRHPPTQHRQPPTH
jgi:hypothetical protein